MTLLAAPEADRSHHVDAPAVGVVRRDERTGITTFRLTNGTELDIGGNVGVCSGLYPPGYLEDLRRDWPE